MKIFGLLSILNLLKWSFDDISKLYGSFDENFVEIYSLICTLNI